MLLAGQAGHYFQIPEGHKPTSGRTGSGACARVYLCACSRIHMSVYPCWPGPEAGPYSVPLPAPAKELPGRVSPGGCSLRVDPSLSEDTQGQACGRGRCLMRSALCRHRLLKAQAAPAQSVKPSRQAVCPDTW